MLETNLEFSIDWVLGRQWPSISNGLAATAGLKGIEQGTKQKQEEHQLRPRATIMGFPSKGELSVQSSIYLPNALLLHSGNSRINKKVNISIHLAPEWRVCDQTVADIGMMSRNMWHSSRMVRRGFPKEPSSQQRSEQEIKFQKLWEIWIRTSQQAVCACPLWPITSRALYDFVEFSHLDEIQNSGETHEFNRTFLVCCCPLEQWFQSLVSESHCRLGEADH